ncbi:MAG: helix-turn-helix transcriptional regulator [Lentisphaeria bacterium]|nr:helix-turn-helix transcriptional regulator [Lentisphaeria bacterium]
MKNNIAITHIDKLFTETHTGMQKSYFSGGISADFDFMPANIIVWRSSNTLNCSDTSIHQRMILKIILSGACMMTVDGLQIPMKKGDMICLFPFQFHSTKLECQRNEYSFLAISFTEQKRNYSSFLPLKNHLLTPGKNDISNIKTLIRASGTTPEFPPERCVFSLLEILLNQRRKVQQLLSGEREQQDLFSKLCNYIRNHFEQPLSLKSLADVFGITPETVRRQFHKAGTGLTPGKLIARLRLQLAVELLEHTETSIAEIASRCGYKDQFTFSRAFKQAMKHSPLHHRKQMQKKNGKQKIYS